MMDENSKSVFQKLIREGVIEEREKDSVGLSESYKQQREAIAQSGAYQNDTEMVAVNRLDTILRTHLDKISDIVNEDEVSDILRNIRCLQKNYPTFNPREIVYCSILIYRFDHDIPETGVPDNFFPLSCIEIDYFIQSHRYALVYFWTDDCDPCVDTKEQLEMIDNNDYNVDLGFGALYGNNCYQYIKDNYDVTMGPTILLFKEGGVDCRLIGYSSRTSIVREMEEMFE